MKDKIVEAQVLLEGVLDTLVEVGNGTTDADLHEAANDLFKFRGIFDQAVLALRLNRIEIDPAPKMEQMNIINPDGTVSEKVGIGVFSTIPNHIKITK